MSILLNLTAVISAIIILGLVGITFYLKYKEEELPRNIEKIWNLMPHYSKGYSGGMLLDIDRGPERSLIKFYPDDFDFSKEKIVKPISIVVENKKIVPLPRGTLSKEIDVMMILPPNPEDLSSEFKSSYFGKIFMKIVEDLNEEITAEKIMRQRIENIDEVRSNMDSGDTFIDALTEIYNLSKDQAKMLAREKGEKLPFSSQPKFPPI